MGWMLALWVWMLSGVGLADSRLERMEEHQRIARTGFIIGAAAPVFVLSAQAMLSLIHI